ncbi:SCP2 sterol-binding domain-containing protein, partial [Phakopsora pachyrhizi]
KAALMNPNLSEEGFETSKVIALIAILLENPVESRPGADASTPSKKKLVKMMKTCYQFVVKNKDGKEALWFIDMKRRGSIGKGKAPFKPDVTIWCSDSDLVALASGEANPQKLYAAARIKIKGNIDKALKVERILSHQREKILRVGKVRKFNVLHILPLAI